MKITPKEIGELFREFASINRETLKQARDTIEEQRKEIQGLNAVCSILKEFRDKAISQGYKPTPESGA